MRTRRLYIVESEGGPIKIGVSEDPVKRLVMLQVGCPDELHLRHVIAVPDAIVTLVEAKVHQALRPHHRRGEWFNIDAGTAFLAIHQIADSFMDELAADLGRPDSLDIEDLINRKYVSPWAREAVAAYRAGKAADRSRYDRLIEKAAGPAALAAFRANLTSHRLIESTLGRNPGAIREARLAFINGLNVAAEIFAGDRESDILAHITSSA